MKRAILVVSVFVVLAAILAVTPAIVGNSDEADERRTATGPMWGDVGSPSTATRPQEEPSQAKVPAASGGKVPGVAKAQPKGNAGKHAAELEKLKKMYAREGMTPELMKRLSALRAAQGGGPAPGAMSSPETMQKLARQRAEMRKRTASAPNQKPPKPPADQPVAVVMGKVTSREKVALTPDAVLSARLLDITRADAPRAIAEQSVANPGKLPTAFVIGYSRQNVDPKHKYAVQVTVEDRGAVRWKTTAECKPVSEGRSVGIEIALQPFKAPNPTAPSVYVGDVAVSFDGPTPFQSDGNWMVPVAPVLKAAGMEIAYSAADKVLTVTQEGTKLSAALPGRTVVLGDGSKRELTAAITVRDGAVYAPMQFLQIATGRKALFDRESNAFVLVKM